MFGELVLLHSAQAASQLKKWPEALAFIDTFLKESSKSSYLPEALYEQGWALKNSGKLKEATAAFEQVVEKSDREVAARAQFMIGEIQFEQKEYKEAVSSYFKAIYGFGDRYPRWQAEALFEAARCFELLSKPDQALKHYEELVQKHPRSDKVPQAKERVTALKKAKSS